MWVTEVPRLKHPCAVGNRRFALPLSNVEVKLLPSPETTTPVMPIIKKVIEATSQTVIVQTSPVGITTIIINRPQHKNAVDGQTAQRLTEAFLAYEADPSQKVCVLHGINGTFCAGFDLNEAAKHGSKALAYVGTPVRSTSNHAKGWRSVGPMGPSRLHIQKPVICAVTGHAVAGGLELSLIGDIRVVEEDTVFGVFCRRWGVPLIDGGTVRLQKIVGLGRALDMILTGRPVSAKEALHIGLANRIVPKGKAVEEALKIANELLQFPQACLNVDRDSCYVAAFDAKTFAQAMTHEFENAIHIVDLEGAKGAAKFQGGEGRHGNFGGKPKL